MPEIKEFKSNKDRYTRIFGAYDIRGVIGEDLDTPTMMHITRAYGGYLYPRQTGHFVTGHDDCWSTDSLL